MDMIYMLVHFMFMTFVPTEKSEIIFTLDD